MAITKAFIFGALAVCALVYIFKHKLPSPFPWGWSALFAGALFAGAIYGRGAFDKFMMFSSMLSTLIIIFNLREHNNKLHNAARVVALIGMVLILGDSFRLIPTPDIIMTPGELQLDGLIRRPYLMEHPNIMASQMLLLPFGLWTIITVLFTQSRGALFGMAPALILRFIPRPWLIWAALAGAALLFLALLIRPDTVFARVTIWNEGLQFFMARPLIGWGTGEYMISVIDPSSPMNSVARTTNMLSAHNALITVAAENGLLGLVPFIGFLISLFRQAAKSSHPARWGLLAFSIQQLFDDNWLDPVTSILLGCSLAVCLFYPVDK
jgi:hypothetical protein